MNQSTSTSTRGLWRVVAQREMTTMLRSKAFLASTAVLLVSLVVLIVVVGALSGREKQSKVAVVDSTSARIVGVGSKVADQIVDNTRLVPKSYADRAAAEKAVRDDDVDVALLPTDGGYQIVGNGKIGDTVGQALKTSVAQTALVSNADKQGVDLQKLRAGTTVDQRLLDPAAKDAGLRQIASFVFVILFYVTALGFGMQIAASVCQEKESRVVEILAAAVPIRALLWGKVIGTSILAIAQVVLLVAVGVVALLVTGHVHALAVVGPAMGWYVVFFVLGFVALASFWAVAGSLAGRQQDLQATTSPAQILLFAPYLIAVTAGEGVRTVVSMLPIVSTMLMPARMAEGSVPAWQIAVAILTTVVAAIVMVRLSGRIYQSTLLRTGHRISFKDALRSRREPEPVTAP